MRLLSSMLAALFFNPFALLSHGAPGPLVSRPADLILINGKIRIDETGKPPVVEAVSIRNGDIATTGANSRILQEKGPDTRVINLKGKAVLPGFHDGSIRLLEGGLTLTKKSDPDFAAKKAAFLEAQDLAVKAGITSVSGPVSDTEIAILKELIKEKRLLLRYEAWGDLEKPSEFLSMRDDHKDSLPIEYVKFGGLVGTIDGDLFGRTAALTAPYSDDKTVQGVPRYAQEKLNELVLKANRAGLSVILRATGDRAVNMAISAFGNARKTLFNARLRNRIEGADLVSAGVRGRISDLNISVIVHPNRLATGQEMSGNLRAFVAQRLGIKRANETFSWRTLLNTKARLVMASDWPSGKIEPLFSIFTAAVRPDKHTSEALPIRESLDAYTLNAAYVTREEHVKGSLREGKWADMIILDQDPYLAAPAALAKTKVLMTISAGRIVFEDTKVMSPGKAE